MIGKPNLSTLCTKSHLCLYWEFFSLPPCPDRLWGPPSLLSSGYQELLPWE